MNTKIQVYRLRQIHYLTTYITEMFVFTVRQTTMSHHQKFSSIERERVVASARSNAADSSGPANRRGGSSSVLPNPGRTQNPPKSICPRSSRTSNAKGTHHIRITLPQHATNPQQRTSSDQRAESLERQHTW